MSEYLFRVTQDCVRLVKIFFFFLARRSSGCRERENKQKQVYLLAEPLCGGMELDAGKATL